MVEATLRAVDPNVSFRAVTASRGKVARAELCRRSTSEVGFITWGRSQNLRISGAALRRISIGPAPAFPGRVDALVWALTYLMLEPMASWGVYEYTGQRALGLQTGRPEGPTDFASAEYRADVIEGAKRLMLRDRRYQHLRGGGPVSTNPAPRPAVRPIYAIGSMEWQRQQEREDADDFPPEARTG